MYRGAGVDLLIVAIAARLRARRMNRLPDPNNPAAIQREQRPASRVTRQCRRRCGLGRDECRAVEKQGSTPE
jgi:hypothetical protein